MVKRILRLIKRLREKRVRIVLMQWFGSYLLILLIPIAISSVSYGAANKIIAENLTNQREYALTQIQTLFDGIDENANAIIKQIILDDFFSEFLAISEFTPENRLEINKATDKLTGILNVNPSIDDLYLYMHNLDCVITDSGIIESALLQKYLVTCNENEGVSWQDIINGKHNTKPYQFGFSFSSQKAVDLICFALPIPLLDPSPNGFAVVGFQKISWNKP